MVLRSSIQHFLLVGFIKNKKIGNLSEKRGFFFSRMERASDLLRTGAIKKDWRQVDQSKKWNSKNVEKVANQKKGREKVGYLSDLKAFPF